MNADDEAASNITDNTAKTGGGIYNAGTLTLSNGIIYQNTASGLTGGIYNTSDSSLALSSTTVADNNYNNPPGTSSQLPLTVVAPDIDGTVAASSANNIIGVADAKMSGISNGDANNNTVGTDQAPINPFVYTVDTLTGTGPGTLPFAVSEADNATQGFPQTIKFASNLDGREQGAGAGAGECPPCTRRD